MKVSKGEKRSKFPFRLFSFPLFVRFLIFTLFGAMFLVPPGGVPPAYAADFILNKSVFGANEQIIIELGAITPGCRDPFGISVSDIYIVPAGAALSRVRLATLDPAGRPNTITGFTGGGFFDEIIGATLPSGRIGNGFWAIVEDRCQDGFFNPGLGDTILDPAFEVVLPVVLPPLDPGILLDKNKAAQQRVRWAAGAVSFQVLLSALELQSALGPFDPVGFAISRATDLV